MSIAYQESVLDEPFVVDQIFSGPKRIQATAVETATADRMTSAIMPRRSRNAWASSLRFGRADTSSSHWTPTFTALQLRHPGARD